MLHTHTTGLRNHKRNVPTLCGMVMWFIADAVVVLTCFAMADSDLQCEQRTFAQWPRPRKYTKQCQMERGTMKV